MSHSRTSRTDRQRGQAILETSLMAPAIFLLFLGIVDVGFYSYAIICTANAARVAALYTSGDSSIVADTTGACAYVLGELQALPNVGSGASCASSVTVGSCTGPGVSGVFCVTAAQANSPDGDLDNCTGSCTNGSCSSSGSCAMGTQVSVTYETIQLFPLPWLSGSLTVTRSAWLRVKGT